MNIYKTVLICVVLFTGIVSCEDMNSIQQQYLDREKRVYLGKTDSLKVYPGNERLKICWYINSDPKIQKTVIYWNQKGDSIVRPFTRIGSGIQKDSIIINNLLGNYLFEIVTKNDNGDKSLPETISGTAYGNDYVNNLVGRSITSMSVTSYNVAAKSGTILLKWGTASTLCISSNLSYKKHSTGEIVNILVNSTDAETVLDDVGNILGKEDDMVKISSLYIPAVGAIDTFPSPVSKEQLASYIANGSRKEYSAAGVLTGTYPFSNLVKTARRITDIVFYCDRVAAYAANVASTNFRLMINPDKTVSISGYYNGVTNLISNSDELSTFDAQTKTFTLKYKQLTAVGGTYRIINETLVLQ